MILYKERSFTEKGIMILQNFLESLYRRRMEGCPYLTDESAINLKKMLKTFFIADIIFIAAQFEKQTVEMVVCIHLILISCSCY